MLDRIVKFIENYQLADKTIIVGFSGGYDSMCLLDILSKIKEQNIFPDMNIVAAHFNHNWRGEESLKEQEICRIFSASRDIEFYTQTAEANIKKTENDARIARYQFFDDVMDEYDADAVFTAHNKDDNAETVLYRVIKGTGIVGLQAIAEHRDCFYRPLLKTSRAEILEYCNLNNLSPNNDSSNNNINYNRNFLRLEILPQLEKINPSVKESLNNLAEVASSENSIIEEYLGSIREKVFNDLGLDVVCYKELSKPVKMRILHEFIQNHGLDYDLKKIKEVYEFIELNINKRNGSTKSLATAMWLYVDNKIIETIPRKKSKPEEVCEDIMIDGEGSYSVKSNTLIIKEYVEKDVLVFPESIANFAYVDFSDIEFPITLRHRLDGDIITPLGMSGSMKLKKYLNAKGIVKHERDKLLLLASGKEILWAIGVGLSEKISVKIKPTHVIEFLDNTRNFSSLEEIINGYDKRE